MKPPFPSDTIESPHSGQILVHKVSGSGLEHPDIRREILRGIQELQHRSIQSVLVSGAGSTLNRTLGKNSLHPSTKLRITHTHDIPHVEAAIRSIGASFAQDCEALGIPFHILPHSVTRARRLLDGHGETGGITSMDDQAITNVLDQGKLAILPFGGVDPAGNTLNVNADDVAARAAAAVGASKLIMYTNAEGILIPGKNSKLRKADFLDFHTLFHLIRKQNPGGTFVIDEGMLPKARAIVEALLYGVPQVHVVQAKARALLEEIFTRTGSGTLIEKEPFLFLDAPAQEQHLSGIVEVREECSSATTPSGVPFLKPMTTAQLRELLPTTITLRQREMLVGTLYYQPVATHPQTASIGGFAVGENHQHSGYGRLLLETMLERLMENGFREAVSITAAQPVKTLYREYGGEVSDAYGTLLAQARKRYGPDAAQVELFAFHLQRRNDA